MRQGQLDERYRTWRGTIKWEASIFISQKNLQTKNVIKCLCPPNSLLGDTLPTYFSRFNLCRLRAICLNSRPADRTCYYKSPLISELHSAHANDVTSTSFSLQVHLHCAANPKAFGHLLHSSHRTYSIRLAEAKSEIQST